MARIDGLVVGHCIAVLTIGGYCVLLFRGVQ
jgi:hypothetical protein